MDIRFDGTHRVRHPEETWTILDRLRTSFGVTRIADVTGLDTLGIPVALAVRPAARTRTVAPGGGTSPLLARVAAAMAAVERWHAEYACPAAGPQHAPAAGLQLPYDVRELPQQPGGLLGRHTPLDWVPADDAVTGAASWVPRDCVALDDEADGTWRPPMLRTTAAGLAGGNSYDEAVSHALYELIERRSTAALDAVPAQERAYVDPASVGDPVCAALLERIEESGTRVRIEYVHNDWDLPCFTAHLWSWEFPVPAYGSGAHSSPTVALQRALTEAARDRLAELTGAHEELRPDSAAPGEPAGRRVTWTELCCVFPRPPGFAEDTQERLWLARRIAGVAGRPPLVVDLSTRPEFSVVKVVAPGLGDLTRGPDGIRAPEPEAAP
ncbi:YcaO-like family protein [Streptomyces triticagri]|uniref:YcaO-like family protein n=1 Tax=Streptomyces triticagri TaxID=2293568 RepID=UPI001F335AF6|nr:YcaO-like family protein [Streptomyces triticagri]